MTFLSRDAMGSVEFEHGEPNTMAVPDLFRRISAIVLRYLILVSFVTCGNINLHTYPCKIFI